MIEQEKQEFGMKKKELKRYHDEKTIMIAVPNGKGRTLYSNLRAEYDSQWDAIILTIDK